MMKLKLICRSKHIAASLGCSNYGFEPRPSTPAVKLLTGNDHSKDLTKEKKTNFIKIEICLSEGPQR